MTSLRSISFKLTSWLGTPASVLLHTVFFIASFCLLFWDVSLSDVLLGLTTVVSLEAIYLAIFIQMTVNRNTESLIGVEQDIEEIHENVEELGEDVEEISENIDEIQEDTLENEEEEATQQITLEKIELGLQKLLADVETLKHHRINPPDQ